MPEFKSFTGINNVQPQHRVADGELVTATNVDIGLSSELRRRQGFTKTVSDEHTNLYQCDGFMLATSGGDLVRSDNGVQTVLQADIGSDRMWYCDLPDGRTTFSNGTVHGVTDGTTTTALGIPLPAAVGAASNTDGNLFPGQYLWAVTHVRLADGLEGGTTHGGSVTVVDGGIAWTDLPTLAGHKTNVYLSGLNGGQLFLLGATLTDSFTYAGTNDAIVVPCRTDQLYPMPVGILHAFWRGRLLVAVGNTLWASQSNRWELCDLMRDYKPFSDPITLVQPVDGGIFVGTEKELAFLAGNTWDGLTYSRKFDMPTVLGSGVTAPGDQIKLGKGVGPAGGGMLAIVGGDIVAGFGDGTVENLTGGRYKTDATEVCAAFRMVYDIPQYVAIPK